MSTKISNKSQRGEHVNDIIERMPKKFGIWVTGIVLFLLAFLISFGFIIQYPDTEAGQIIINAKSSPVKLVALASGKITLLKGEPKKFVKEGDYIAYIQNPADLPNVLKIKKLLDSFNLIGSSYKKFFTAFPDKVSLGEINGKYYAFLNVFHKIFYNEIGNSFHKQEEGLKEQILQLSSLQGDYEKLERTRENNMLLYKKLNDRDSILFKKGGTVEADFDQSRILYLNSKASYQSLKSEINSVNQKLNDFKNKQELLNIEREDEDNKLNLDLISAYDDLKDGILAWEQKYVFKAPMNGQVDFLKFWNNNQFIQAGEDAFTVIPKNNKVIGQMHLPSLGSGKVKIGQEVIIKLDNYPFHEFGSVKGRVSAISLTTNITKNNDKKDVEVYLVEVELPNDLTTNYGQKLDFKYEIKGIGEIISNKRNLIERFFDNLKYSVNKT